MRNHPIINSVKTLLSALLPSLLFVLITLPTAHAQQGVQLPELEVTYFRQGVDYKYYNQFILSTLDVDNTRLIPPPWVENPDPKQWQLSDQNKDFLRVAYREAMKRGLEESGEFKVVTEPLRGTLELEMRLISLAPYAHQGEKVTTKGYGELTFEAVLRDARTGEMLSLFQGTQKVGEDYQENTDFNKASNLAQHFANWGRRVSARMSAAHQRGQ